MIYVPDPEPDSVLVIKGYELKDNPLIAYRGDAIVKEFQREAKPASSRLG